MTRIFSSGNYLVMDNGIKIKYIPLSVARFSVNGSSYTIKDRDDVAGLSINYTEVLKEDGEEYSSEDAFLTFLKSATGFNSGGGNGQGVAFNLRDVESQAHDIGIEDKGSLIQIKHNGDWSSVLPSIDGVDDNFNFTLIHKESDMNIGSIVPFGSDLIDGSPTLAVFGKGAVSIRKRTIEGSSEWFVSNRVSYDDVHLQGKTRETSFENQSVVEVEHNFGFVPIVQIWVEDGEGGFVQANVDVDHNWITKNSFLVNFGIVCSGKIIY